MPANDGMGWPVEALLAGVMAELSALTDIH